MSLIVWNDSYSVKVSTCDDDHKKLFAIINQLHDAMKVGKGSQMIQSSLKELANYTKYHFGREEAMLEKANYPELAAHRAQHRVFVEKVDYFQQQAKEGKTTQTVEVSTFLRDWLLNHIQKTDKRYSSHLNACGVA